MIKSCFFFSFKESAKLRLLNILVPDVPYVVLALVPDVLHVLLALVSHSLSALHALVPLVPNVLHDQHCALLYRFQKNSKKSLP